ncbi:phosphoinositide-binding protein, putative [Plasmodium chabaudi chabaudi]|uniref:Phosphoinositide-binding protein, putative n=1 Tax=Plasmodium chabaudi chabaudi TaxID=31271 RepID=A0A1D3RTA3_PLACU|nr:phosphoinositide-binding protein, putative [Plasmodium chabaudi chabaudi]
MELEHFNICINRVDSRDDKIYYIILVNYKDLKYEVSRRYSEFENLHCELMHLGYSALPNLPKKKLVSYNNHEYINYRKRILNNYIQDLFVRADIRCCATFLNFILFYDKINLSIDVVKTKLLNSVGPQKYSLSDLYINEKNNFIICVYEDKSNFSKLGKLWSIIEPDMIGEIKVFTYNNDLTSTFVETHKEQTIYKARNIIWSEKNNEAIISGDDGKIHIYKLNLELLILTYIKSIPCHNDTILKMSSINDNFFCTCGYDNAFRIIDLCDYKILSGGRCNKRLDNDKITTCHLFQYNNLVIGTNNSLFFIYNMSFNPPIYLDTKKLKNGNKIKCFTNTEKYMFIGYDNIIACYNYQYVNEVISTNSVEISDEQKMANAPQGTMSMENNRNDPYSINNYNTNKPKNITKLVVDNNMCAQYVPPLLYDNRVLSLSVNKDKKILYAGYEDAIIVWSITTGLIISSFHAHSNGVYFLKFMYSSELLLSGGNSGNLKIWKNDIDNFEVWKPQKNYKTKYTQENYREYNKNRNNDKFEQNQFHFDESDNNSNCGYCSTQSDSRSIDNLLEETNKKHEYNVFDTSNYKKNIVNYNASTKENIMKSSQSNIFYEQSTNSLNELTSDVTNLDICIITNKNEKKNINNNRDSYDKQGFTDHYYNTDINNSLKMDNLKYVSQNEPSSYDYISTENKNNYITSENEIKNYNIYSSQYDRNNMEYDHNTDLPTFDQNINPKNSIPYSSNHVSTKNYNYNNNYSPIKNNIQFDNTDSTLYMANINENDDSYNLKKNIVHVSDDDDDLISAFR